MRTASAKDAAPGARLSTGSDAGRRRGSTLGAKQVGRNSDRRGIRRYLRARGPFENWPPVGVGVGVGVAGEGSRVEEEDAPLVGDGPGPTDALEPLVATVFPSTFAATFATL